MNHFLHRHVLLPAFDALKRRSTFRHWRDLERTQWSNRETLARLQLEALQRLLAHASEQCVYYHDAWNLRGLDAGRLHSLADFSRWPITSRDDIRANRLAMRAGNRSGRLISKSTGGSSGVPLQFDLDLDSNDRRTAAWHRGYGWANAAPGTKQFYLWGVALGEQPAWRRAKEAAYNRLHRKRVWSSFDLSEARVPAVVDALERYRPDAIVAYTKPLYELARSLDERNVRPFSPKSIVVGAEKLHDFERERIERVFRSPVFETYGSREFMLIGAECAEHRGLHLTAEHLLVEILDADGHPAAADDEGDLVITDLYNYGMPFIRYATGDRAIAGSDACACGRGLPLLKKVVGRQLDMLRTPDGRLVPGEFFPHLIKDFRSVRHFQVSQETINLVRLRVVADVGFDDATRGQLERVIRQRLGPHVRFELDIVDAIPLTAVGKRQVVVNKVPYRRAG